MTFAQDSSKPETEILTLQEGELSIEQTSREGGRLPHAIERNPLPASLSLEMPVGDERSFVNDHEEAVHSLISTLLLDAGYEIVQLEFHLGRHKVVRLFIEKREWDQEGITVEDCARVTHLLDQPLEALPAMESLFKGGYELEVSSPGIDRFLHRVSDLQRYQTREVRLHLRTALSAEECENPEFAKAHPKQVTFLGILKGWSDSAKLQLEVLKDDGSAGAIKKGAKPSPSQQKKKKAAQNPVICIPLERILKVQLEPEYDLSE